MQLLILFLRGLGRIVVGKLPEVADVPETTPAQTTLDTRQQER